MKFLCSNNAFSTVAEAYLDHIVQRGHLTALHVLVDSVWVDVSACTVLDEKPHIGTPALLFAV